jgi:hypothetical protein
VGAAKPLTGKPGGKQKARGKPLAFAFTRTFRDYFFSGDFGSVPGGMSVFVIWPLVPL